MYLITLDGKEDQGAYQGREIPGWHWSWQLERNQTVVGGPRDEPKVQEQQRLEGCGIAGAKCKLHSQDRPDSG